MVHFIGCVVQEHQRRVSGRVVVQIFAGYELTHRHRTIVPLILVRASRPAKAGDLLVTTSFKGPTSRGFCASGKPDVAVCLMPGTELAFVREPTREGFFSSLLLKLGIGRIGSNLARFRNVDLDCPSAHHDALEYSNGRIVLLNALRRRQHATVLQLPVMAEVQIAKIRPDNRPFPGGREHDAPHVIGS
jgi:hypothetical protein